MKVDENVLDLKWMCFGFELKKMKIDQERYKVVFNVGCKLVLIWISIYKIPWKIVFIVKGSMDMCLWSVCDSSKIWDLIKWSFVGCYGWFKMTYGYF